MYLPTYEHGRTNLRWRHGYEAKSTEGEHGVASLDVVCFGVAVW